VAGLTNLQVLTSEDVANLEVRRSRVLGALLWGYWGACKAPGQQLWTGWESQKEAAGLSIQC
jgi:hypothetical protein